MSRFFVGQRVRVARNVGEKLFDYLIGMESIVREISSEEQGLGIPGHRIFLAGYGCVFHPDDLEPILPSGQVAVTLEQLLNVPGLQSLEKILGAEA